jgi:metallo-beta-lactamase class B
MQFIDVLSCSRDNRVTKFRATRRSHIVATASLILAALAGRAQAQGTAEWTEPFPPFHIAGNLYYVGSKGLANYLITTPQGNILINSDLEANVPLSGHESRSRPPRWR